MRPSSKIRSRIRAFFGKPLGLLVAVLTLAACGGHGGGGSAPPTQTPPRTYTATVTAVEIVRSADALDVPVAGLPADGAVLSVR